ncbi:addiction module protein [Roseimaritima ulvae]|uniref:Addiction module component n=1 Tax=Roseimaritima ulvae TaxID=980254 RepID=A0A5B9QML6_9BACT|nr:addiction module protein [Roseimaritima ulvae]QEG39102.1 Putative addiction module component [Roseimaritima ulvae]
MSDVPIPSNIRNLPVADRIELAPKIWESVAEDKAAIGLSDEHKRIIDERIREADEKAESLISAEDVFRDLMGEQ